MASSMRNPLLDQMLPFEEGKDERDDDDDDDDEVDYDEYQSRLSSEEEGELRSDDEEAEWRYRFHRAARPKERRDGGRMRNGADNGRFTSERSFLSGVQPNGRGFEGEKWISNVGAGGEPQSSENGGDKGCPNGVAEAKRPSNVEGGDEDDDDDDDLFSDDDDDYYFDSDCENDTANTANGNESKGKESLLNTPDTSPAWTEKSPNPRSPLSEPPRRSPSPDKQSTSPPAESSRLSRPPIDPPSRKLSPAPPSNATHASTKKPPLPNASPRSEHDSPPSTPSPTPPSQAHLDVEYTESLHWKHIHAASMYKRPTDPAQDVEHIHEVEWADESHSHHHHHRDTDTLPSLQPSPAEMAPRPKIQRPDSCFCEPNISSQEMCCVDESCALFACQEECANNCPAGPLCGNKRIQRRQWKKLQVFDAGLKGRGLLVHERCRKGDFICEYVGVAVRRKYLDGIFNRYKNERMLYIMALDGDVYIDARHRGGIARYINHSCEPNCAVHRWKVRGIIRACVFALREIRAGEELSFDYQWDRKRGRAPTKCYCGSDFCRGTLEIAKDCEEQELEDQLSGHWILPTNQRPGAEIVNRVIQVYFDDNQEYYVADVAQYDASTGKHQLLYRGDMDDYWTDLEHETWMILDEEGEKLSIARKERAEDEQESLLPPPAGSTVTSPHSDSMSRSSSPLPPVVPGIKVKNYIIVQTPVKDAMSARHVMFKCGRYCRVHVDVVHLTVRDRHDGDDEELKKAMDESQDGSVWKLVVTGMEPRKAIEYLEKMSNIIQNTLNGVVGSSKGGTLLGYGPAGNTTPNRSIRTEIILPRCIVDSVKKKLPLFKARCHGVDLTFAHSDSKSKQFFKMKLGSDLASDMELALEYLNNEMTQICLSANAPMTSLSVYKDLGYLGGELSSEDFRLLFDTKKTHSISTDCNEDLRGSIFASSFEEANRCSIWVQAEEDMGRISNNRIINEADPNQPRKVFFGVNPSRIAILWSYLQTRLTELKRGVQFLNLGADRIYQPTLLEPIRKNGRPGGNNYFFDFIHKTTGASVRIDSITCNHLRIDGGDATVSAITARQVNRKINLAKELISLQIELLRDHHIRQQRWGFGRDWAILLESDVKNQSQNESSAANDHTISPKPSISKSLRLSDPRILGSACLEISEIVFSIGLAERVSAHACIIFYRYINIPSNSNILNTSFKLRDIQLATLFIANKAQKVMKWKRLEDVLEHAYRVFYPGSIFDKHSEEAMNWERRVITSERNVLKSLNYDVFWPGVDWVVNAVTGAGALENPRAESTMSLTLSGHVLAAGPILWLKYGPKYAFAAVAGFLEIDLEPLFPALSLLPLTVSHAAELIYNSCRALSNARRNASMKSSRHELFTEKYTPIMQTRIQEIQKQCAKYMSVCKGKNFSDFSFVSSAAYEEISRNSNLRRVFRGVKADCIEERILPSLSKICFESKCAIRFAEGAAEGTHDVILEGNWKSLSIAEHLFCEAAAISSPKSVVDRCFENSTNSPKTVPIPSVTPLPANIYIAQDYHPSNDGALIKQVKVQPGLLEMKEIDGTGGWEGTVDFTSDDNSSITCEAGWKTCVAAKAPQQHLQKAGLRWWVPPQYGPSLSGSICEIFSSPKLIKPGGEVDMYALASLAQSFAGSYASLKEAYPHLASLLPIPVDDLLQEAGRTIAVSLQRWPPEKIEAKELSFNGSSTNRKMQMGFSVAALQEMQLLQQLHFLIPSPQGHPNFILPLAIALDSEGKKDRKESSPNEDALSNRIVTNQADLPSLLAMIEGNKKASEKRQLSPGSHLVLEPTPLVLQKVMIRFNRKSNVGSIIPSSVLASWCHDILSAVAFCHTNHIILRSLLPDQILIDHSGTAKLSGLSKVMVLHGSDRTKDFDPAKYVRPRRSCGKSFRHEEVEPFVAPELLMGGTRYTKESDIWAIGSLLACLLLEKQLIPGRDRLSKTIATFKVVGVPSDDNFPKAVLFPFYNDCMEEAGKKKKYKRGVAKALRVLLKGFGINPEEHFDLIQLIDSMLHLDPKKRITAGKALEQEYMKKYAADIKSEGFRRKYVQDWMALKENILSTEMPPKRNKHVNGHGVTSQRDENDQLNGKWEKDLKRKAFLMKASMGGNGDDLYNLDDFLSLGSSQKKRKVSKK